MAKSKITLEEVKNYVNLFGIETLVDTINTDKIANKKLKELLNTYIDCQAEVTDAECGLLWAEDEINKYLKRK